MLRRLVFVGFLPAMGTRADQSDHAAGQKSVKGSAGPGQAEPKKCTNAAGAKEDQADHPAANQSVSKSSQHRGRQRQQGQPGRRTAEQSRRRRHFAVPGHQTDNAADPGQEEKTIHRTHDRPAAGRRKLLLAEVHRPVGRGVGPRAAR